MDKLVSAGWELPDLSPGAKEKVKSIIGEKASVVIQNPVDLTGAGFLPTIYSRVLDVILSEDYDAYFLVWDYNPLVRIPAVEFVNLASRFAGRPVVVAMLANQMESVSYMETFASRGICAYLTPEDGASALNALLARQIYLKREGLQ
jgi:acyl-CoA synthetase (NDP forming)